MKFPQFEVFQGKSHLFYWRLRARNGEILCVSEGYTSPGNAKKGAKACRRNALLGKIVMK